MYDELKNICVSVKNNAGQGRFYRSQHELVFVFKHGRVLHLNTFELGSTADALERGHYAGVNSFRAGRMDDLEYTSDGQAGGTLWPIPCGTARSWIDRPAYAFAAQGPRSWRPTNMAARLILELEPGAM